MDESLLGYAQEAVKELKEAGEWDADEEALSIFTDYAPKNEITKLPLRAVILLILRGESPEGIYVYFEPKAHNRPANVEEVKRQIRVYFQDGSHRYDWPVAFSVNQFREDFLRTYEDWSPEEEFCYAAMVAKGKARTEIAKIFQRLPGVALTPPHETEPAPAIAEDSAINLLGLEVRCGNCYHSRLITPTMLRHTAKKASANISAFSKSAFAEALKQFKCGKCGMKTAKIDN
jgi:hypothetical protein